MIIGATIKSRQITNKNSILTLLFAVDAIFTIDPYFTWSTYTNAAFFIYIKEFIEMVIVILVLMNIIVRCHIKKKNLYASLWFAGIFIYRIINNYYGLSGIYISVILEGLAAIFFIIIDDNYKSEVLRKFIYIFTITLIPGIIVTILHFIGVNLPHTFIQSNETIKVLHGIGYYVYPGAVMQSQGYTMKLCGIYDEPGRVGTIIGLLLPLIMTKTWAQTNKWRKITTTILLLSGFLSLSVVFYLLFAIYMAFFLLKKGEKLSNKKIMHIGIGIMGFAIVGFVFANNETFQRLVLSRMTIERLINNNRISQTFMTLYTNFLHSSYLWIGYGASNPIGSLVDAAGYQIIVFYFGLIGFGLLVGFIAYICFPNIKKSKDIFVLVLFFILSFYQRGWIFPLYHWVILLGGIAFLQQIPKQKMEEIQYGQCAISDNHNIDI